MNQYSKLAVALATATLLAASVAQAKDDLMIVRLNDLNVAAEPGARIALNRIRRTSAQFCGEGETRDLRRMQEQKACVATMTRKAVETLNAPRVTQLYNPNASILLAQGEAPAH